MKKLPLVTGTLISFWFLIITVGCSNGDQPGNDADSIVRPGNTTARSDDSLFIADLLEEAWRLQATNPDSCIAVAKQALSLSQEQNFSSFSAEAYCRIGNSEEAKGNLDTALNNYICAFLFDSVSNNLHGMARDNYQVGIVLKKQGKYSDALTYSTKALSVWEQMPEKKTNVANVCISIGNIYQRQGQFDMALEYFFRCLDTAQATNSNGLIADAYKSIGLVYENQGLYDQALEMYNQSLTLDEQRNNQKGIAGAYNNIGNVHYRKGELNEALTSYLKSIDLKEKLGLTQGVAGTYNNIGLIYEGLDIYPEAIEYHNKSLALRESAGDMQGMATSHNNIGVVLLRQGQQEDAISSFERALEIATKSEGHFIQLEILKNLSDAHAANKDFKTAFFYTRKYQAERDSIEAHFRKATETDISYKEEKAKRELLEKEQEKKDAEFEKNQAVNKTQTILLYSLIVFVCLLLLLFFAYWKYKRSSLLIEREEQRNRQQIEDLVKSQELNALRMMLETQEKERKRIAQDLHDRLGIKLSTAKLYYGLIGKKLQGHVEPDELEKYQSGNSMLDEACDELRKVAHDLVSGELMKFGLVKALQNLCTTIVDASHLKIEFHAYGMDDRLDGAAEHSLYQIVQELLTNIMRHARAKEVTIQINRYNHTLNILVEDDGIGFNQEVVSRNSGLGLNNVRDRVRQLNGILNIDSSLGRGTIISIDLSI